MAALVSLPPEVIDPAQAETSQAIYIVRPDGSCGIEVGRFQYGGHYYCVLEGLGLHGQSGDIRVYKRATLASNPPSDQTAWTLMDSANEPPGGRVAAIFDGTSIHIFYREDPTGLSRIILFNCSTDSYGSPSVAGPDIGPVTLPEGISFQRLSNGNYYIYYTGTPVGGPGFDTQVFYITLTAGVWSAPTSVYHYTAHAGYLAVNGGLVDSTDVTHLFVNVFVSVPVAPDPSTDTLVLYIQISATGVVSAAVQIDSWFTNPLTVNSAGKFWGGIPVIWQGTKLAFVYAYGAENLIFAAIGTPLAAPVWTIDEIAHGVDGTVPNPFFTGASLNQNGDLVGTWVYQLTGIVDHIWINTNTGSGWGTPVLFYDAIANPPPVDPFLPDPIAHRLGQLRQDANGTLSLMLTLEAFGPISTGFILFAGTPTPPTLACPVNNTAAVGAPYSGALIASGGTPPYTFSAVGLPLGFAVNATTGVISGTPTIQGPFSYTVTVTDANGLTAVVTCTIIIAPPTGAAGRRPQPFIPNPFDACLARDFRRYSSIDYSRLGCGKLPDCFRVDERTWGDPTP